MDHALKQEKKRFRLTLIIVGIFLIFFYGEFFALLKMLSVKKRSRRYIRYFYYALVMAIMTGAILKKRAQWRTV